MHERTKLKEAEYFHQQMGKHNDDRELFINNFSAFLSAARCVLQYALEEVDPRQPPTPQGKRAGGTRRKWYNSSIKNSRTLGYFKEKRDINIHSMPVKPTQQTTATLSGTARIVAALDGVVKDRDGNVIGEISQSNLGAPSTPTVPPTITRRHIFSDWSGTEDVLALSRLHLQELEKVIQDGVSRGYLKAP